MRAADSTNVSEQLQSARELLSQGRADEAQQVIDDVLEHRARLPQEDVVRSCGLLARLLALRGERIRAWMMAELAVQLAGACATSPCQAYAYLDQAHTLRTLGQGDEALDCLRRAHALAPRDVPWASCWEAFALVS
jgi:tetratricopeptide (TPR) repeat protein